MALWGKTDASASVPKWFDKYSKMDSLATNIPTVPGRQVLFISIEEAQLEENIKRGFDTPGWWSYYTIEMPDGTVRYKTECLVVIHDTQANANDGTYARYDGGASRNDDEQAADSTPTPITISVQPANQSTRTPAGAILTFTRAGTAAAGTASYSVSGTPSGSGIASVFTVARAGGVYTVTNTAAGSGYAAAETITVLGSVLGGVDTTNDLTITVSTVATAAATFSVTAAGQATLQYQWQRQTATGTTWTAVSGATSSSLALTALTTASTGYKYRVRITSTGGATTLTSDSATLTVTAA
jgi:hypothetical protein